MANILKLVTDYIGLTESKGLKRALSFIFLFLAAKYPDLFSNPQIVEWLAALGFTIGQVHSLSEK